MKMVNIIQDNLKIVYFMEKEQNIIETEILNMMVNFLMIKEKEKGNIFLTMVNIIQENLKMVYFMEKAYFIIQMEILNMMVNL